ncbi:MAG TPA: glycosyltransferase family 2 protein [Desulfarculaceae bacterium]|nr:glycosyltransferase family 2 protein [Desulfarculaceae bacterium]
MSKICVIVLNYNGWADTIECLESLLRSTYHNYQIVVVDNDSTDNSLKYCKAWANGSLSLFTNPDSPLKDLSWPPTIKPITYAAYIQAELNLKENYAKIRGATEQIIFIEAEKNRGYAAGNNIGLKWAAINNSFSHYWLLNNDTVVAQDSLEELVKYTQNNNTAITGTSLINYNKPHAIQSLGGHINRFFGTSHPIHKKDELEKKLDYIEGAAFLIEKECLNRNGFLQEEYFLYFEETDYCFKARKNQLTLGVALKATVFHKEVLSSEIKLGHRANHKNEYRDMLALESRIRFSRKYLHNRLGLKLGLVISAIIRIKRKQFQRAWQIIRKLFN